MIGRPPRPAHERVLAKTARGDLFEGSPCWVFQGVLDRNGYGRTSIGSTRDASFRMAFTHRVVYEALVGPIPDGLVIDHRCRNTSCCNPAHLEPVTSAENTRRGVSGERQKARTHCPFGHEYAGANLYVSPRGKRNCRACNNRRARDYRARKSAGVAQ